MISLLGTSLGVFLGVTVMLMGFAAYMTGQALALAWKPVWQGIGYCLILGLGDRFLTFALFEGELLSITGYLVDSAVLVAIFLFAFRLNRAHKMVSQYPWLYERTGPFTWRARAAER
ncbi:MAG: hypothetical protein R3286_09170 [Gammaproteobacteria bacterium]|nr:hypothetical protein [Gammaproteobacteria bacterium]